MNSQLFQGVVVNASFPRSGHRFLRELCVGYFGRNMRFYDTYSKNAIISGKVTNEAALTCNYIKTHDFDLEGFSIVNDIFPLRRKYLVQVRHPLESIASYYEFALKNNEIKQDTKKNWLLFLNEKLAYWEGFCKTWLYEDSKQVLLVKYEDLYTNTALEMHKVIKFITNAEYVDKEKVLSLINKKNFNQYVGENNSQKSKKRELRDFKYFDLAYFKTLELRLADAYFSALGIKCLFNS